MMIERLTAVTLAATLNESPTVALLGPRQVGKTTLALALAKKRPSLYLDLESERDRAKLADPEAYLEKFEDRLVILDEVQRWPGLFQILRGLIDRGRRRGRRTGQFLLLGSASLDLLLQSSESLAGRIVYLEMPPIHGLEVPGTQLERLWSRGGFPESFLASSDQVSLRWRQNFIRTYLERDIPQFGPRLPAETLRRFWTMLAHQQSALLNASQLANSLGVSAKTVGSYLDLLVDLLLVRRLEPWHSNMGKRLVKSPRIYVRDTGLVHALLGLGTVEDILSHPVAGATWETLAIETLISVLPPGAQANFYRTAAGAEIDLLITTPDQNLWAFEIKRSSSPKVERGFHQACVDLAPARRILIYPGNEVYPGPNGIEVMPLAEAARSLLR